jgi:hypothetical protein
MKNPFFMWQVKKIPGYKSCRPWNDAHLYKKWGQNSKVCCETCTNHGQKGRKPSELLLGAIFCGEFFLKPWYDMFGIFPR